MSWKTRNRKDKSKFSQEALQEELFNSLFLNKARVDIAQHTVDYICTYLRDPNITIMHIDSFKTTKSISDHIEIIYVYEEPIEFYSMNESTLILKKIGGGGYNLEKDNRIEFGVNHHDNHLLIDQIISYPINFGYGSKMMDYLLKYAEMKKLKVIVGNLDPSDIKEHGERLLHFYEKYKFQIKYDEQGVPISIRKDLEET